MKNNPSTTTEPITRALIVVDDEAALEEHYFYSYRYRSGGLWFSTTLYKTIEEADSALKNITSPINQKKLCCVRL